MTRGGAGLFIVESRNGDAGVRLESYWQDSLDREGQVSRSLAGNSFSGEGPRGRAIRRGGGFGAPCGSVGGVT